MRRLLFFLLVALVVTAPAFAQATIQGRVTDSSGGAVPGADITLTATNYRRAVVTSAEGTYRVTGLAPDSYSVLVTLSGFCPARRDVVVIKDQAVEANATLSVAPATGPLWITLDTAYYWQHADVVVYLRIDEALEMKDWPAPTCGSIACTTYRATVLSVAKRRGDAAPLDRTFTFLQDYVGFFSGEPAYDKGDEFLAFLSWNPVWGTFVRLGGPPSLLPVKNGRVVARSAPGRDFNGLTVEECLAKLRALDSRKQ